MNDIEISLPGRGIRINLVFWIWGLSLGTSFIFELPLPWMSLGAALLCIAIAPFLKSWYPDRRYVCSDDHCDLWVNQRRIRIPIADISNIWALQTGYRGVVATIKSRSGDTIDTPLIKDMKPFYVRLFDRLDSMPSTSREIDSRVRAYFKV